MQITQYPRNTDGSPMELMVGVIVDSTGNNGARLTNPPTGPDRAPIRAVGIVLVAPDGSPYPTNNIATVSSLAELGAAYTGTPRYLNYGGRSGDFVYNASDLSALVALDTLQGIYVPPTATPNGSAGAWVRVWDGIHGAPEWFGAISNSGGVNNANALIACHTMCPIMSFQNADYFYQGTLNFNLSYRAFQGVRGDGLDTGHGTRLVRTGAGCNVGALVRFGLSADPGAIASYLTNIYLDGLSFNRDIATGGLVAAHASGLPQSSVNGIEYRFIKNCRFDYINSFGSPVAHSARGVINTKINDWGAARFEQSAGTQVGGLIPNDVFVGFDAGGDAAATGLAGANASLTIGKGNVTASALYPYSATVRGWGYCADTYVDYVESSNLSFGVDFDGRKTDGSPVTTASAHQNIKIERIVADGVPSAGVFLRYLNASGTVAVNMIYAASTGTGAVVNLTSCAALVRIDNLSTPCATTATAIRADSSSNFKIAGSVRDAYQVAAINNCFNFDLDIDAYRATAGGIAAIALTQCSRSRVELALNGGVLDAYDNGITMDSATNYCEITGTRINPGCLTTDSAALKILYNGADASAGAGATAFAAANNVLTGVKN